MSAIQLLCEELDTQTVLQYERTTGFTLGRCHVCELNQKCSHKAPLAIIVEKPNLPVEFLLTSVEYEKDGVPVELLSLEPKGDFALACEIHWKFTLAERFGRDVGWGPSFIETSADESVTKLLDDLEREQLEIPLVTRITDYLVEFEELYNQKLHEITQEELRIEQRRREDLENPL